jgi:PAS domain S-box-containing protein
VKITSGIFKGGEMKNQSQPLRNMNKSILKQKNIDTNKEKKAANNSILTKAKNNEWKKNTGKPSYDVTWEWNKATGEIYVGDSIEEVFGYKVQNNTVSFMDFSSCLLPGEKDIVEEKLWKTLSSDSRSWKDSFMFKRLDGSIVATACRAKIVRDEEGNAIHLTGTIQDVSRLERLENNLKEQIILRTEQSEIFEAALRKSESNLQAIFENTSQGFILTDLNGIIKLFNNKSREIIRLNAERKIKIGDSLFDFIHPSRKGKYKHAITKVLGGETLRYDYPYTRKNGELKWFDFTVNPVYSGGAITGLIITSTDITERKQAEERLQRSESNLNAIIENTDAHIYSLDRNLRYITFNQRLKNTLKESFGMDIKIGDYILDFIIRFNPQDAEEWKTVYSKGI